MIRDRLPSLIHSLPKRVLPTPQPVEGLTTTSDAPAISVLVVMAGKLGHRDCNEGTRVAAGGCGVVEVEMTHAPAGMEKQRER